MSDLNDGNVQTALVTGASRGIGRAIAAELAARGFRVIGTATSDAGAQAITDALAGHSGCKGVKLDVNDGAGVSALVDGIVKEYGGTCSSTTPASRATAWPCA
jgi:3-oxoacyl-[acyl-carrier protein] reductase